MDALKSLKESLAAIDTELLKWSLETNAQGFPGSVSRSDTQTIIGLMTARACDVELRQVFRERLIDPPTAILKQVFDQAVARGEAETDCKVDLWVTLLTALMIPHLLTLGEVFDDHFARLFTSDVILPLATPPTNSSTRLRTRN